MRFVRGMSVAAAASLLMVGGMAPALAQDAEVCGPYTSIACDEDPEEQPEVLDDALEGTPEAGDEVAAVADDTSVLGVALARTGMDAWLLALVGALAIGVGVVALRMRRGTTDTTL